MEGMLIKVQYGVNNIFSSFANKSTCMNNTIIVGLSIPGAGIVIKPFPMT